MRLKINLENISDKSIVNEGSRRIFKNQTETNKKKTVYRDYWTLYLDGEEVKVAALKSISFLTTEG